MKNKDINPSFSTPITVAPIQNNMSYGKKIDQIEFIDNNVPIFENKKDDYYNNKRGNNYKSENYNNNYKGNKDAYYTDNKSYNNNNEYDQGYDNTNTYNNK
jgi:hypothetical protein